jgi:hypothetical protein
MAAITDKARDFWDRISPRERRLVVIGTIAAPITLAVWLGLAIHDGLLAMEARNDKARKALAVLADMRVRGQTHEEVDDAVAKMGTEPLPLNSYLDKAAQKAKFTLKGTSPHPAVTKNGFVTTSVSLSQDKLTIEELRAFLSETASKTVAVTHLDLHKDFRDKDKLDVSLEVSSYSKEPPAKSDAAGSASGSDSKKGS